MKGQWRRSFISEMTVRIEEKKKKRDNNRMKRKIKRITLTGKENGK